MFNPQLKSTGRDYSTTIALLAAAVLFIPFILIASRPFGTLALCAAAAGGAMCVFLAWIQWKRHSQLTIPTMETVERRTE